MLFQAVFTTEALTAFGAFVRFYARMARLVDVQDGPAGEAFAALCALERLLAGVRPDVLDQAKLLEVQLAAFYTFVPRSFAHV